IVELVVRPGGHGLVALAKDCEVDDFYRARRATRRFALHRGDPVYPRIREDRGIELRRLFGFLRVPQKREDLRLCLQPHGPTLLLNVATISSTRAHDLDPRFCDTR